MLRKTLLTSFLVSGALLLPAACADVWRAPAQPMASPPPATLAVIGLGASTPASISSVVPSGTSPVLVPTFAPAALNPMTSPAPLPTAGTALYVIENHGKPHFLEFHAWW